jgi:hypothetical protein
VQVALRQLRDAPEALPADVPENVRVLIGRAIVKDPARRLADGDAFAAAVDDVLAGRMLAPPPSDGRTRVLDAHAWASSGPVPARRRAHRVLVPLVALLAGAGIAVAGLGVLGNGQPPPAAAEGTDPSAVVLVADAYVGRPVEEVEAELGALGLRVERSAEETTASAPGLVTGLTPAGAVRKGDLITLTYAVAPDPAPEAVVPQGVVPEVIVPEIVIPDIVIPDLGLPRVVVPPPADDGDRDDDPDDDG